MARLTLSISQLISLGFGVRTALNRYPPIDPEADDSAEGRNNDPYGSIAVYAHPAGMRRSVLGTPVWDTFQLRIPGPALAYTGDTDPWTLQLPDATLVEFSRAKRIVMTQVQGRDGSIKELVGMDDWTIAVRSVAVNYERLEYPHQYIDRVLAFLEHPGALEAISPHFNDKGIHNVVVESYRLPQVEGYPSLAPIELQLRSDTATALQMRDEQRPTSFTPQFQ
jgi:hypothetical protein